MCGVGVTIDYKGLYAKLNNVSISKRNWGTRFIVMSISSISIMCDSAPKQQWHLFTTIFLQLLADWRIPTFDHLSYKPNLAPRGYLFVKSKITSKCSVFVEEWKRKVDLLENSAFAETCSNAMNNQRCATMYRPYVQGGPVGWCSKSKKASIYNRVVNWSVQQIKLGP